MLRTMKTVRNAATSLELATAATRDDLDAVRADVADALSEVKTAAQWASVLCQVLVMVALGVMAEMVIRDLLQG